MSPDSVRSKINIRTAFQLLKWSGRSKNEQEYCRRQCGSRFEVRPNLGGGKLTYGDLDRAAAKLDIFSGMLQENRATLAKALPNHRDGLVHQTRDDANADNEHFVGKTTNNISTESRVSFSNFHHGVLN